MSHHPLLEDTAGRNSLAGARCSACDTHTFPTQSACPKCGSSMDPVSLPHRGTVWSWTVQRIAPKPPYRGTDPFEPFVVAYVDLGPLLVESRLFGRPVDGWSIGDAVTLSDDGVSYWFEAVEARP